MRKLKIKLVVSIVLISIVAVVAIASMLLLTGPVSIGGGDSSWDALWTGGTQNYYGSSGTRYGFLVSDVTATKYNNIYCIEHEGRLKEGQTVSWWSGKSNLYLVRAVITLHGDAEGTGYVKYYDEDEFWYGDTEGVNKGEKLKPGMHNRIMAAILNNWDYENGLWMGNRDWHEFYTITTSII